MNICRYLYRYRLDIDADITYIGIDIDTDICACWKGIKGILRKFSMTIAGTIKQNNNNNLKK